MMKMGDMFKKAIFEEQWRLTLLGWAEDAKKKTRPPFSPFLKKLWPKSKRENKSGNEVQMQQMASEASAGFQIAHPAALEEIVESLVEHPETQAV